MEFNYTLQTQKDFEQTTADLKNALVENKFGVLWEMDIPAKLKEKGVDYKGKARIFEVCNPHKAKEALETNINVIYFLPCKIVMYEEDNKTKLGMVKPTVLMQMFEDETLKVFAEDVEKTIKTALEQAIA